jgi:hypothetical protein
MESTVSHSQEILAAVSLLDHLLDGFKARRRQWAAFSSSDVANMKKSIDFTREWFDTSLALLEKAKADPNIPAETLRLVYQNHEKSRTYVQYLRRDRDSIAAMGLIERLIGLLLSGPTFLNLLRVDAYLQRVLTPTIEAVEARDRVVREQWNRAVKLDPSLAEGAEINASNYDPSEFIPADFSKIPPRPQPRLG